MRKSKILLVVTLVVSMLLAMGLSVNAASNAKVMLDGKELGSDQARFEGSVALLPLRAIAEGLGGMVEYNAATRKIVITTAVYQMEFSSESKTATVDGNIITMDTPLRGFAGKNYISENFVEKYFDADVTYNSSTNIVNVTFCTNMSGTLKLSGSTTIYPIAQEAADQLMKLNSGKLTVSVLQGGSGVGKKDIVAGTVNIGNSSAALTTSERTSIPGILQTQIGSDAIAVIVNKKNPVKGLTKQQVYDIFTGATVNWKTVGGNDAPILVQIRESTSGTYTSFRDLAIKPIKDTPFPNSFTPNPSSGTLMQAVSSNENAIGFDSLGFINDTVKPLAINDIECTFNNAFTNVYPYVRQLVMLTKGVPSSLTAKYINFIRSTEGQKILVDKTKDMDYIPLRDPYTKKVGK
jgi:phosphate transport system substrate-binding protein